MERIEIKEIIEKSFPGYQVTIASVSKNNMKKTGITIRKPGEEIAPTVFLEDFKTENELLEFLPSVLDMELPKFNNSVLQDPNNIFYYIVGDHNTELLKDSIYQKIPDTNLVKLYRVLVNKDDTGVQSTIIKKNMNDWTDDFIFQKGEENTPKLFPPKMMDLGAMFGFPELEETKMEVLSNQAGINGAAALFYPDIMDKVLLPGETKAVILPSSVHEVIVVHGKEIEESDDFTDLYEMVKSINGDPSMIRKEDILTDSIYLYKKGDEIKEIIF